MGMAEDAKADEFALYINFKRNTSNPSRVFRTADEMIRAFQQLDASLVRCIDPNISTEFLLQEVEAGSIRVVLKNALKAGDWNRVVGSFINTARCVIIEKLEQAEDTRSIALLDETAKEIQKLAAETDVKYLPAYAILDRTTLTDHFIQLSIAKSHLQKDDVITYESPERKVSFVTGKSLSRGSFDEILIKETVITDQTMIIKVKKPDYLGASQWQFLHDGHVIDAKMIHVEWLEGFQQKRVEVKPGDALRVKAFRHTQYGHDNEIVHTKFDIVEIVEVIPSAFQTKLPLS